jgi:hypothetical protein
MLSKKPLPSKLESLGGIVPSGSPIALLGKAATGVTLFALVTLSPTSSPVGHLAFIAFGFPRRDKP